MVLVNVFWEGKRKILLPSNKKYVTVSKFPEDISWPEEAWSVILNFDVPPSEQGNPSKGIAQFLLKNAPQERFSVGKEFSLYEGRELTASVVVIGHLKK